MAAEHDELRYNERDARHAGNILSWILEQKKSALVHSQIILLKTVWHT